MQSIMSMLAASPLTWYLLRGVPSLLARNTILGNLQMALLPDDQWQLEQEYVFQANFAAVQTRLVDFARGFWLGSSELCHDGIECDRICSSQVRVLHTQTDSTNIY